MRVLGGKRAHGPLKMGLCSDKSGNSIIMAYLCIKTDKKLLNPRLRNIVYNNLLTCFGLFNVYVLFGIMA